jgi:hypothetical protein
MVTIGGDGSLAGAWAVFTSTTDAGVTSIGSTCTSFAAVLDFLLFFVSGGVGLGASTGGG